MFNNCKNYRTDGGDTWVIGGKLQVEADAEVVGLETGGGTTAWTDITGKPSTFTPTIGITATTAKAGNYAPTWDEVTGKPSTFAPTIGVTASTAKAGNYAPAWSEVTSKPTTFAPVTATASVVGGVKQAATQADSTATDAAGLATDFNALLAKLKAAGIMA